jgi:DNA polymerase zeta
MNHSKTEVNVPQGWEKWVMTAFESVEALWEQGLRTRTSQPSDRAPQVDESTKHVTQPEEELNPFSSTQAEQNQRMQTTHVSSADDVDEDVAAGQALQRLVIAAEEGDDWHDDDEPWEDDLLYEDELREAATQVTNREISVPATPTYVPMHHGYDRTKCRNNRKQRFRTTTPMSSSPRDSPSISPDRARSRR